MPQLALAAITRETARGELAKFLSLVQQLGAPLPMFSDRVDAEWHRLMEDPEEYARFCYSSVGRHVRHAELSGYGEITWVADYHRQFGDLPPVWFANGNGVVDQAAYGKYRSTGTVTASWDCSPVGGDSD